MSFRSATRALASEGGMARTSTLRSLGVTARELARARAAGEIVRPRQGLYALPTRDAAEFHAASHGGVPASVSAARLHGLWVIDDGKSHVWMGAAGRRLGTCTECCLHWSTGPLTAAALPSVARTLLQIVHCRGDEEFFAALESALRQRLLTARQLRWLGDKVPPRMRWLIGFARPDADSGLESIMRLRLHRRGIDVRVQVVFHGRRRVDLLIGERLLVEIDGCQNHEGESLRHRDLTRDAEAAIWGYETLRFHFAMVMHDGELVEQALLAKIAQGAHLWPRR
ncbi:type IV toxin-antitoxin system AbiEi family antitoxin domain-containing protein [Microbacterium sp. ZW T5_45]|uniref:type IV toxin-antitoxin system AbiEi family antitoxin domain-containing protein n=1 Tax=Microbacterium sp. ZW T5_45 TaxID=3378080 RepID=UPI00385286E1